MLQYSSKGIESMTEQKLLMLSKKIKDSAVAFHLASSYFHKPGRTEDEMKKAAVYYTVAADMGNIQAACRAGCCYLYGKGVETDLKQAFFYFSAAAEKENIRALYHLGDFYMHGTGGTEINKEKAASCYERAYQKAIERVLDEVLYPDICLKLADCYFYGTGKEKNYRFALDLYEDAESQFKFRISRGDKFSDEKLQRAIMGIKKCRELLREK